MRTLQRGKSTYLKGQRQSILYNNDFPLQVSHDNKECFKLFIKFMECLQKGILLKKKFKLYNTKI